MISLSKWACCLVIASTALALKVKAQQVTAPHCFSMKVRLDGKPLEQPNAIVFYTKEHEWSVTQEGGCFDLSSLPPLEKFFDISFDVLDSRILFPRLSASTLAGPWDIDLYDKASAEKLGLAKGTRVQTVCRVVFHAGEPEAGEVHTACRKKIR